MWWHHTYYYVRRVLEFKAMIRLSFALYVMLLCNISYASETAYELFISKSKQQLVVKKGKQTVQQFYVAYGMGGSETKQKLGDKKTPDGIYHIASLRDSGKFSYFMHLNYPNALDVWRGYQNGIITAGQFKELMLAIRNNQLPPQNTELGGYIGIHGLGKITPEKLEIHTQSNWTQGCVALTNGKIYELKQYVSLGTKVTIAE